MAATSTPKIQSNQVKVYEEPPELGAQLLTYKLEQCHLVEIEPEAPKRTRKKIMDGPYLIIGFDTEFKTPEYHVSRDDINSGQFLTNFTLKRLMALSGRVLIAPKAKSA